MKKTNRNLMLCAMIFVVSLVVANMVTAKTFTTGIPLFGHDIILPGAVFCYALTFLMTDVVGEIWGKREAQTVVLCGFVCQVFALILVLFTQTLPAVNPDMQHAYDMLLGQNAVFVLGSMTAYLLSQSWDVVIFHKLRNHFVSNTGEGVAKRWIWNNASTMTSQIIDTAVFIIISFGFGMGWIFHLETLPQLGGMIVGQYLLKFVLATLDTPVFYFLTRRSHAGLQVGKQVSVLDA